MQCKFETNEILKQAGAPHYIRGDAFSTKHVLRQFTLLDQMINATTQAENIELMRTEEGGWVCFVCGVPEMTKLFAISLMAHYAKETTSLLWHHVTASKWDKLTEAKERRYPHMIVLDSLLTHPPMHPNGFRAYDPTRIGKIFDIVSMYRGKSSILILCPELEPEEAYRCSNVQPEFMLNLLPKMKDREL